MKSITYQFCVKMGTLSINFGLLLLAVLSWSSAESVLEYKTFANDFESVNLEKVGESGSFDLVSTRRDGIKNTVVRIGMTMVNKPLRVDQKPNEFDLEYENDIRFKFTAHEIQGQGLKLTFNWTAPLTQRFQDCVRFGKSHWYGGPQQKYQYWPIEQSQFNEYSYVTKEADNCAITEPYWLNSEGTYVYVDAQVPLFIDQNHWEPNSICFISEVKPPYTTWRTRTTFSYTIVLMGDARTAHEHAVQNFLGKPTGQPDFRMIQHPVWSTWALYKRDINEKTVMELAKDILKHKFNNSQFEIDDSWETCYGSLTVNTKKFPNFKKLNLKLKQMGFRVTLWIHPFINKGCEPYYSEAISKSYLVRSETGSVDTDWWNNNNTKGAYVDFTNPAARDWWLDRLKAAQKLYAIDSFKFDAGESSWSPQIPLQSGDPEEHPSLITREYVKAVAQFGPMVEVRTGQRTQDLPIFVRMVDKDTYWDFRNGLATLVTTLLQMNINGYSLVLPDMIGGNGYNEPPSKELFIRWLQANVFMPSLQYSYVPWLFDKETVNISQKFTKLHADFAPAVAAAFARSVETGAPTNPPIWWIDPHDQEALKIWDEYLLGEDILVAPVLKPGALDRDVYLPKGKWLAEGNVDRVMEGGQWHRKYSAPLDCLPYFIRMK